MAIAPCRGVLQEHAMSIAIDRLAPGGLLPLRPLPSATKVAGKPLSGGDASSGGPPPVSYGTGPSAPAGSSLSLEGLQRAWGENRSVYDLNRDQTVNVDDLLRFLLGQAPQGALPAVERMQPAPELKAEVAPDIGPALSVAADEAPAAPEPGPADPHAALEDLRQAWGQSGSPHDHDADGAVDVDDLLHLLLNWPMGGSAAVTGGPSLAQHLIHRLDEAAGNLNVVA
jgi:hypothetical protein